MSAVLLSIACGSDSSGPEAPAVASLQMTYTGGVVSIGAAQSMGLVYFDKTGKVILTGSGAVWTSSNPAVASVDATGNVQGLALGGPVTITASDAGKSVTATVSVVPAGINFSGAVGALIVGGTVQLTATAYDASLHTISAGPATWRVSPPDYSSVDANGVVTALAPGFFSVLATIAGRVGSVQILAGVVTPFDGTWSGPNGTPQFNVSLGLVSGFSRTGISLQNCGTTSMLMSGTAVIANSQWSIFGTASVPVTDLNGSRTVMGAYSAGGTFTSPTTMNGTLGSFSFGQLACPSSSVGFLFSGTGTFTATKQ